MTNDIITDLSKFHDLFVIASNTAFPNDADSYEAVGWIRLWSGQTDAAVESLELALRLDRSAPRNTLMHLGMAYYLKERYRDAIAILEKG